ncbi:MAG: hypothetical protein JO248_17100 [Acidimicrobiia bacterium]|nr:hypothetical protein [Acidimicrobiia bacterium]
MKRFLFINGLVAVVAAATVGVLAGGTAHAIYYCTGNITGQTINDTVFVPAGATCSSFGNTHISGNLQTQPGGAVVFEGQSPGSITIGGSAYIKSAGAGSAGSNIICGTTISQSLYIQNNANPVSAGPGACGVPDTVSGSVYIQYNTASVNVSGNTGAGEIGQNVNISHNSGGGFVTLNGNDIDGLVSVTVNTGGGQITNNVIDGSLTAQNNTPPYSVSGNTVGGVCNNNGTHSC